MSDINASKVKCSYTDCKHGYHNFRKKRFGKNSVRSEKCRECGETVVDWNRLDENNIQDIKYTISMLKYQAIRDLYWNKTIDEKAKQLAFKHGLTKIKEDVTKRMKKFRDTPSSNFFRDGTQIKQDGNIIYYAQHATATCCRKCMEEWHGFGRETTLTDKQMSYAIDLIMYYIKVRLPNLSSEGS